jgi:predicted metalloprotease with PDZ domain
MKLWLALAVALSTLHGAEPTPQLTYSLRAQGGVLHVELVLSRIGREIDLVPPKAWGDAVGLNRGVTNLHALEGQIIRTDDPAGKTKVQTVKGRARIAYDLTQDWSGVLRESVRHRPHLDSSHFEVNTANALIHPRLDVAQSVDCTFKWRVPVGWALITTFGTTVSRGSEVRQRFRGPWNDVANAMFAAGDFRLIHSKIGRGVLVTAIRGNFGFSDAEANEKIVKLMRLERDFWRDNDFPYFVVTLTAYGAGQSGSGGGGFTNAFNLYTSMENPFSAGLLSLLAHETFHTWNPLKMGRIRSPQENTNWFTEGFTTYYQDLLLWQAGLIDEVQYLDAVNRFIRDYHFSPARNAALQELITRSRQDQAKSRIPYERGAMIALCLDDDIRRHSNGKSSLDTLMRELFDERKHHADLSKERIFAAIGRHVDAGILDKIREQVDSGTTIEAPQKVRVPCAQRVVLDMPEFELGMDRTALIENHRVMALKPGSAAERAGARNGDVVIGAGVYWNDVTRLVRLTMKGGKKVEYLPLGSNRQIPQYRCP